MLRLLLPLNVTTTREGWLRLTAFFAVMCILLVTAIVCVVYELSVLTVVDRDFRDLLWDYRVTQPGVARYHAMLGTAYWPTYLARVAEWEIEVLRPSIDIPTIVIFTGSAAECSRRIGSVTTNICSQMEEAVELAVGESPGRIRVVREPSGSVSPVPQLQVYYNEVQQPEALISPNRVSLTEVDAFVSSVIDNYVDPAYIPPRMGTAYTTLSNSLRVEGQRIELFLMATESPDIQRFMWPWELWPWPRPCTNTSFSLNVLQSLITTRVPGLRLSSGTLLIPRVEATFLGSQTAQVDWYDVKFHANGTIGVGVLRQLVVRVLMVPQEGACCAWRLQGAEGQYSRPIITTVQNAPSDLGSMNIELLVDVRDMAEPLEPVFPRTKGPALIYCGIIFGGSSFVMLGLTPILMFLVYHQVMVNSGLPPPFYIYSRKYRGW